MAAVVNIVATLPGSGDPAAGATLTVEHITGVTTPGHTGAGEILGTETITLDENGEHSLSLEPCTGDLEGTIYVVRHGNRSWRLQPITDGEWLIGDPAIQAPGGAPGVQYETGPAGEPGGPSLSGDLADRPAAAATDDNTLYFAEDTGTAYHRPTTAVWQQIAPPVDALDDLDELANGVGTVLDTGTAGFVSVDRHMERLFSAGSIASTAAETSILQATVDFAANTFANDDPWIFGEAWINLTQNNATPRDFTIRIKLDGVTIYTVSLTGLTQSATNRPVHLQWSWVFGNFIGSSIPFGGCHYALGPPGGGAMVSHGVVTGATSGHTLSNVLSFDITTQHSFSASTVATTLLVGSVGVRSIS